MQIHQSGEDYLETILILENKTGYVRSIDVANELGYTKASISRAMSILRKDNYITMDNSGQIHLTEKGLKKASQIYERHKIITEFLINVLDVEIKTAEEDACRIEHVISEMSFNKIKEFLSGYQNE